MYMKQSEIVNQIRIFCDHVELLPIKADSCHFVYNDRHYIYVSSRDKTLLRFCIPHLIGMTGFDKDRIVEVVNDTNKNIKYIKAVVLERGSISLNYDYRISCDEPDTNVVRHIIRSLDFAAGYLLNRLKVSPTNPHRL